MDVMSNGDNSNHNHHNDLLSTTCMTLCDFKAQWMILLQRGNDVLQQSVFALQQQQEEEKDNNDKNGKCASCITTESNDGRMNTDDMMTTGFKDVRTFRKRRRLLGDGRFNHHPSIHSIPPTSSNRYRTTVPRNNNNKNDYDNITTSATTTTTRNNDDNDPYDCHYQVKIPSSHDIIDRVVDDVIHQWRALDERKVSSSSSATAVHSNKGLPKWYEKHIRLPDQFDLYATLQKEPSDDENGDRVINFNDPTRTLSYRTELEKLFAAVPTRLQIEELTCRHHQLPNTEIWFHTLGGGTMFQGTKSIPTAEWDYHGLSRFRMNDRHDLPPLLLLPPPSKVPKRTSVTAASSQKHTTTCANDDPLVSTTTTTYCGLLRFECLRKQLRRSSTPDSNRMVIEFLESQTLYDVHCTIVELTDDELWYDYAKNVPTSSISTKTNDDDDDDDSGDEDDNSTTSKDEIEACNIDSQQQEQEVLQPHVSDPTDVKKDSSLSSGYFFIENTFYTTGSVDYTTPIIQWLQTGTNREQKRRMEHLGIGPDLPMIKCMKDMKLYHLPTRLGVRYVHVHNGDVECAMFVSDRRLLTQQIVQQIHQFPIIHDIWTSSYSIPECDICQNRVAVIATSTECTITNGHAALCDACCRQLRLQHTSRHHIERYTIWRGQSDVSAGVSNEISW